MVTTKIPRRPWKWQISLLLLLNCQKVILFFPSEFWYIEVSPCMRWCKDHARWEFWWQWYWWYWYCWDCDQSLSWGHWVRHNKVITTSRHSTTIILLSLQQECIWYWRHHSWQWLMTVHNNMGGELNSRVHYLVSESDFWILYRQVRWTSKAKCLQSTCL